MRKLPKFSQFLQLDEVVANGFEETLLKYFEYARYVQIIAYCIMPTHLHLVLKQLKDNGIQIFMSNLLNSYTRYFNIRHKRKGPLWVSRFKNVRVENDEQLIHLTRYVHLNPTSADLVTKPKDWQFSSIREYTGENIYTIKMCQFEYIIKINPKDYSQFVDDYTESQRELAMIKNLTLD